MSPDVAARSVKYAAFISYRREGEDAEWARRLHRSLERFRLTRAFARGRGLPRALGRVFLDDAELPASADLGEDLRAALAGSGHLIVVCSPSAASSPWIDAEVHAFTELRGREHVLAVLVRGEPLEAFPASMRSTLAPSESLGHGARATEPAAADVRPSQRTSETARLRIATVRLAAAMLGVGFDELWERDVRRRKRFARTLATGIAAVLAAGGVGLAQVRRSTQQADADRRRRVETEFAAMRENGRRDVLASRWAEAIPHLEAALRVHPDDPAARFLLARARAVATPVARTRKALPSEIVAIAFPGGRPVAAAGGSAALLAKDGSVERGISDVVGWSEDLSRIVASGPPGERPSWTATDSATGASRALEAPAAGTLQCLAVSPHGSFLAVSIASQEDGRERGWIWDLRGDAAPVALELEETPAEEISFTPDEASLVIARVTDEKGTWFTIHAPKDGRRSLRVEAPGEPAGGLSLSPDGTRAVLVGASGAIRLLEVPSLRHVASWEAGTSASWSCTFSPDGTRMLTPEPTLRTSLREVSSGRAIVSLELGEFDTDGALYADVEGATLRVDPVDGRVIETVAQAGVQVVHGTRGRVGFVHDDERMQADVLELPSGRRLGSIPMPASERTSATDAAGRVWLGCWDGSIVDFEPSSLTPRRDAEFRELRSGVVLAGFAQGGHALAVVTADGVGRVFDLASGAPMIEHAVGGGEARGAALSADGSRLAVFGLERTVVVDVPTRASEAWSTPVIDVDRDALRDPGDSTLRILPGLVTRGGLDATGARLLVASRHAPWALVQRAGADAPERLAVPANVVAAAVATRAPIAALALEPATVVRVGLDGSARVETRFANAAVRRIAISQDGSRVAVSLADGSVAVLGADGKIALTIAVGAAPAGALAFDASGTRLFAATSDGRGVIVSTTDGAVLGRVEQSAAGGRDPGTLAFPLGDDEEALDRRRYPNAIHVATFDPTGAFLATGSNDSTVAIWDVATQALLAVRRVDGNGGVSCLAYSSDGALLAAGDSFASAFVWDVSLLPR